jgi:hypothetical protein
LIFIKIVPRAQPRTHSLDGTAPLGFPIERLVDTLGEIPPMVKDKALFPPQKRPGTEKGHKEAKGSLQ